MAKLTFFYGTMSSGKTTDLIQTAYKYNSKGMKPIIMKPSIDTKGDNQVVSRVGLTMKVDILLDKDESINKYNDLIENIDCFIVDEAQFLTKKQVIELYIYAKTYDTPVICYGLKNDFQGNLFEGTAALFSYADQIEKLRSLCATPNCRNNAAFNARKINGKYVYEGPQVLIGCDDEYDPLCGDCYIENVLKPFNKEC